jgi:hypothetical protein
MSSQDCVEVVDQDKIDAELNKIREENKEQPPAAASVEPLQIGEQKAAEDQNMDAENANAQVEDNQQNNPENPQNASESPQVDEVPQMQNVAPVAEEKSAEEMEREKQEREALLLRRQQMLMQLANSDAADGEAMDFNEGEAAADKMMDESDQLAPERVLRLRLVRPGSPGRAAGECTSRLRGADFGVVDGQDPGSKRPHFLGEGARVSSA